VFLTGATGYIGSAVLDALARAGHDVTALVRSQSAAERLAHRTDKWIVGDLATPESYVQRAAGFDAYVHTAFEPSARGAEIDVAAVDALLALARQSSAQVLVYTSGIWVLGSTPGADESAPVNPAALVQFRAGVERKVLDAAGGSLRTVVIRPAIVFGGGRGIVGDLIKDAENGVMRVVGSGENHWPLVYDRDLADLYARLLASPDAAGVYHASDDSTERVIDVVEAIASFAAQRPEIRFMPIAEARGKLGPYADAISLDQIVRSPRSKALGWQPSLGSLVRNVPRLVEEWRNARNG
jgi:nucleoside-diphosphate-sugar epimerase